MIFLIALGFVAFLMVCATGLVESFARWRHWEAFDDRPIRYDPRRTNGKPW